MTYERLNSAIKIPSHIMKNCFRDPQQTLAYKWQCRALNLLLENRDNRDFISVYKSVQFSISELRLEHLEIPLAANNEMVEVTEKLL